MKEVGIIGAGAAGLIAAGRAAERGHRVFLFEKNKLAGKKLRITGREDAILQTPATWIHLYPMFREMGGFYTHPSILFPMHRSWSFLKKWGFR